MGAGHKSMRMQHFNVVIIDEVTKDAEPACIIPILRGTADARVYIADYCTCNNSNILFINLSRLSKLVTLDNYALSL